MKRHKYGVSQAAEREYRGVVYHSKWEKQVAQELDLLATEAAGDCAIRCWFRQVRVTLGPDFSTVVDFLVIPRTERPYFVEAKGVETADFRRIRRLWPKYGPLELRIRKRGQGLEVIEAAER